MSSYEKEEKNKGRLEKRTVQVFAASKTKQEEWAGLQTYILLCSSGIREGKPYFEEHYYISSLPSSLTAESFAAKIRGHWSIENVNHYQKDVFLREDTNKISNTNAASCIAVLNNITVNITGKFKFKSLKECHNTLKNKIKETLDYLRT